MPSKNSLLSLKTELSKAAKLSKVQSCLPPILMMAPVVAIAVGEAIAKQTNGQNLVEDRILGQNELFQLHGPEKQRKLFSSSNSSDSTSPREAMAPEAGLVDKSGGVSVTNIGQRRLQTLQFKPPSHGKLAPYPLISFSVASRSVVSFQHVTMSVIQMKKA